MALCILLLKNRVHYLPIITAIFILASVFLSYGVSVANGHVEIDFPYISHTAIKTPERCIFSQLINMGAFLMAANVYVRYLYQRELFKKHGSNTRADVRDRKISIAALVCGWLSAFGLSMVANFQTIVMRLPHNIGAGLAFGMCLVYCWLQTSIALRRAPGHGVTISQLVTSIVLTVILLIFVISKAIFRIKEHRGEGTKEGELRVVYLISTISEWLTVVALLSFVLTFYHDFSKVTLQGPRVLLSEDRNSRVASNDMQLTVANDASLPV